MKYLVSLVFSLTLAASIAAEAETLLRLHGSNTIGARLAPALVDQWMQSKGMTGIHHRRLGHEEQAVTAKDSRGKGVRVEIFAHGSSTAFSAFAAGQADLGMASRPIKRKEVALLSSLGSMRSPAAEHVLGLDGIAVIVHPANPLSRLDKSTVGKIFSGEIHDWSQAGGGSGRIHIYARDHKSGTFDTFKSLVLDGRPLSVQAKRFESSTELSDAVAQDRLGIGFIGLPYVLQAKALAISEKETAAIAPASFSVATEDYALARRLFLYLPPKHPHPFAKSLVEFALSEAGQAVVAKEGLVSQSILAGKIKVPAKAPAEYRRLIRGAQRLSVNFRFREGSPYPDSKAMRDAKRMADFMRRPQNAGRKLILCGFADKAEAIPLYSLDLSIQRADSIADLLIANGVRPMRVRGYGTAVPVAANDNRRGRQKNRRVEVWME